MKLYEAGEIDKLAEQYEVADMLCLGDNESGDADASEETEEAETEEATDDAE